nr:MAG TPA: Thermonuclease [Caudoviricetes sp.]
MLNSKEQTKVRLYGIDAPEKKQDYDQKTYCSADIWNEDMYVYYALIKNIPN